MYAWHEHNCIALRGLFTIPLTIRRPPDLTFQAKFVAAQLNLPAHTVSSDLLGALDCCVEGDGEGTSASSASDDSDDSDASDSDGGNVFRLRAADKLPRLLVGIHSIDGSALRSAEAQTAIR